MKILCIQFPAAMHYIAEAWRAVFEEFEHQWVYWNPQVKPAFDVFSEYEPDLFIGTTYNLDRATCKNIEKRPQMDVILRCSNYGPENNKFDLRKYPVLVAKQDEVKLVEKLYQNTGKPNFVYSHYPDKYIEDTLGWWRNVGVKPIGLINCANVHDVVGGEYREELACDIGMISGYWPYKARNIDRFLLPLCYPVGNYNIKIFGYGWGVPQYLGPISDRVAKHLYQSAKILPAIHEPHSTDFGWDITDRVFKTLAAGGGLVISDYVKGLRELFDPYELIMCERPEDFEDAVNDYLNDTLDEVNGHVKAGQRAVFRSHTNYHRVSKLASQLGYQELVSQCQAKIKEINSGTI